MISTLLGLCRVVYGCAGLCRAMQGYVGLCRAIYGYVGLCKAMYSPVKLWFSIKLIATESFSTPSNCWMAI